MYMPMVAALAMFATADSMAAGKDKPPQVRYHNVSFNELIAVYRQAYSAAGLEFVGLMREGPTLTELVFELPRHERIQPETSSIRSFTIISSGKGDEICAPCTVYISRFVGDPRDYTAENFMALAAKLREADRLASAHIRAKLGKAFDFQ